MHVNHNHTGAMSLAYMSGEIAPHTVRKEIKKDSLPPDCREQANPKIKQVRTSD